MQKQQGVVTRVGSTHSAMGGYTRGRKWRVEERHRFITAQLYPTSDDGGNYREQFQQVCCPFTYVFGDRLSVGTMLIHDESQVS